MNTQDYTRLQRHVRRWLKDYDEGPKGALRDLFYPGGGGCQSGVVGHLIYYTDTVKFYKRHRAEISALLKELIESTGEPIHALFGDGWDSDDPLADDTHNQNLLAWFGFEETARQVADDMGIEI